MATIRPLGDRVLIKRLEAEAKTAGGIVLPDTAKEKPKQGEVIAIGTGKVLDSGEKAEFQVKEGDVVLFGSFAGTEVTVDGEEFLLMSENDILATIKLFDLQCFNWHPFALSKTNCGFGWSSIFIKGTFSRWSFDYSNFIIL